MNKLFLVLIAAMSISSAEAVIVIREHDCAVVQTKPQDPSTFEGRGTKKNQRKNKSGKPKR